jgi:hypothetical protein
MNCEIASFLFSCSIHSPAMTALPKLLLAKKSPKKGSWWGERGSLGARASPSLVPARKGRGRPGQRRW